MNKMPEQNVPTTASIGSYRGEGAYTTSTNNLYLERDAEFIIQYRNQSASGLLYNLSHSMSSSVARDLTDEISIRKLVLPHEISLAFLGKLKVISRSRGLTQATALRKLDELKNLPEDWDSYGADLISPNAIAKAKAILTSVMIAFDRIIGIVVQLTDVIPIADGGVQLEWIGPHAELEIEISPTGNISLLYISGSEDRRTYEESEDNSLDDVNAKIAKLILSQYNNQSVW